MTDPLGNTWDHKIAKVKPSSTRAKCYANCAKPISHVGLYKKLERGKVKPHRRFMCKDHAKKWKAKYQPKETMWTKK